APRWRAGPRPPRPGGGRAQRRRRRRVAPRRAPFDRSRPASHGLLQRSGGLQGLDRAVGADEQWHTPSALDAAGELLALHDLYELAGALLADAGELPGSDRKPALRRDEPCELVGPEAQSDLRQLEAAPRPVDAHAR